MLEDLLELSPEKQPRGIRMSPEPVEHHRHAELKPTEGPRLRETDDPAMGSALPLEGDVPSLEVADVVGHKDALQLRCARARHRPWHRGDR